MPSTCGNAVAAKPAYCNTVVRQSASTCAHLHKCSLATLGRICKHAVFGPLGTRRGRKKSRPHAWGRPTALTEALARAHVPYCVLVFHQHLPLFSAGVLTGGTYASAPPSSLHQRIKSILQRRLRFGPFIARDGLKQPKSCTANRPNARFAAQKSPHRRSGEGRSFVHRSFRLRDSLLRSMLR